MTLNFPLCSVESIVSKNVEASPKHMALLIALRLRYVPLGYLCLINKHLKQTPALFSHGNNVKVLQLTLNASLIYLKNELQLEFLTLRVHELEERSLQVENI